MAGNVPKVYNFMSEENATKWKGLLHTGLKKVPSHIHTHTHTHTHTHYTHTHTTHTHPLVHRHSLTSHIHVTEHITH